jgi:hypothetical protein
MCISRRRNDMLRDRNHTRGSASAIKDVEGRRSRGSGEAARRTAHAPSEWIWTST